jgi:alpha-ribazole phosphatase
MRGPRHEAPAVRRRRPAQPLPVGESRGTAAGAMPAPATATWGGKAWAIAWRHPRIKGALGRCLGARSDPPADARRAKRLAHRIRAVARRERLARRVAVSPARRCRAVGRWLRRFGFAVRVEARLREFDFGAWDGLRWDDVPLGELDAWCGDFAGCAPGSGDTLEDFLERLRPLHARPPAPLWVTHGGVLSALRWLESARGAAVPASASQWPAPPSCGSSLRWRPQGEAATASLAARGAPGAGVLGR